MSGAGNQAQSLCKRLCCCHPWERILLEELEITIAILLITHTFGAGINVL